MGRAWVIGLVLAAGVVGKAAYGADAFDAMRLRWQVKLTGAPTLDRSDPDVAAQLQARAHAAQGWLARMHRERATERLWDDLAGFHDSKGLLASAAVTANATRLDEMALAWASPGSPLYHDERLGAAVVAGIDWLVAQYYRAGRPSYGNWWDWQIGTPLHVLNLASLMYELMPDALRQRCLAAVDWYVPNPRYRTRRDGTLDREAEAGANLLDKALVVILRGMLGKETARIASGRDAIAPAMEYVTRGDGFYRDGSFIQHTYVPYGANYGAVALADFARLLYLLSGSDWQVTGPHLGRVFLWARDSFAPLLVDGAAPDALRGRRISVANQTDHSVGRGMAASLAALAEAAPPADATWLRSAVKGWMTRDRSFGPRYFAGPGGAGTSSLPLYELGLLKAIASDPSIAAASEPLGARLYPSMDRAFLRGPGFAAVLSMTSPRTSAFEAGNGENLQGWWTGMGQLNLYDADQVQFSRDYWATVDMRRLPGITTDHSGGGQPKEWTQYPNPEAWVGGASLGQAAALGMAFSLREVTGSQLQGRKAWFFLGDRIVAVGGGIRDGAAGTETVVENRRLAKPETATLLVDGMPLANGTRAQARWAHLDDASAGSRIGYLFPQGAMLQAQRAERSGSWREVNEQQSPAVLHATYQSLTIPQSGPDYAYVLLPGASAAATRAAAEQDGLRIESNDAQATAISDAASGVYAADLWRAGSAPRGEQPYVTGSAPMAVVLQESAGRLALAVADPTQQAEELELTLARPAGVVLSASAGVTVLETAPRLRLRIHTGGAAGASFEARFRTDLP